MLRDLHQNSDLSPFVARFSVYSSDSSWEGSGGLKTELLCQFLSPWVLRKEVDRILQIWGIDYLCSTQFRKQNQTNATVFWNLLILFRKYQLPFAFLLQEEQSVTPSFNAMEDVL